MDCAVGTTDRFLSSVSPFMCVESNSGVADPGAAAARPSTRVILVQNSSKTTKKFFTFLRFDLYQRPSSEEAGTRSSSSGSWRD